MRNFLALRLFYATHALGLMAVASIIVVFANGWFVADDVAAFWPQLAYLGALLALATPLLTRHRFLYLLSCGLLISLLVVALTRSDARDALSADAPAKAPTVVIASANVEAGNPTPEKIEAWVLDLHPDAIVFPEMTAAIWNGMPRLRAAYPFAITEFRPDSFGIAVASKARMTGDASTRPDLSGLPPVITARICPPNKPDACESGETYTLLGVHTLPPVSDIYDFARRAQIAELPENAGTTFVAGDFNATPWSAAWRERRVYRSARSPWQGVWGYGTWPATAPQWLRAPIDHIFFDEHHATRIAFGVGPDIGSDHAPIWAKFALSPTPL